MGLKGSKQLIISYEDAIKRLSDAEASRIKEAFRRLSGTSGVLSKTAFMRDVLGENVPSALAEHIFTLYGGTARGIGWKELVCGLVLLTRGSKEERTQFAYAVFASNNEGASISREDIERLLIQIEGSVAPEVRFLFAKGSEVGYESFCNWMSEYPLATSVTRWLLYEPRPISLSNEVDSLTFYQSLAGVTHLEESEILELEKAYLTIEKLGRFDLQYFMDSITIPFPVEHQKLGERLCEGLFYALDENRDQHIDFKEEVCGISAACRGPIAERLKFAFKVWDRNRDGFLDMDALKAMLTTFLIIDGFTKDALSTDLETGVEEIISTISTQYSLNNGFSAEDFLLWSFGESVAHSFISFVSKVFTVHFCLKPASRREEGETVLRWLELRKKYPPQISQTWYIVATDWWKGWLDYVLREHSSDLGSSGAPALHHSVSVSSFASFASAATDNGDDGKSVISLRSGEKRGYSKPGPIENACLLAQDQPKVAKLTNEGGILKKGIGEERDYEHVPKELWVCLSMWYSYVTVIPRTLRPKGPEKYEIELYPVVLKIYRHSQTPTALPPPAAGIGMAFGAVALGGGYGYYGSSPSKPQRYLAYSACFSQTANIGQIMNYLSAKLNLSYDNFRLWHMKDNELILLDAESNTLEMLGFQEENILLEVRSSDQTWPEEIGSLASGASSLTRNQKSVKNGTTGLYNLGNTCFMNSALQCVSNTTPLTQYFLAKNYMKELNRTNPLGMKGQMAMSYGELVKNLWEGFCRNTSPGILRDTIYKYAPRFGDCQQHDAQELLAFLLDGLHEDLNRITDKPYVELKDSDGRPDEDVAFEAWENHMRRNRSIIVDLFHGQLKSKLTCATCRRESVRFDPFTYLSLPLPLDNFIHVEVTYLPVDGEKPTKYGLLLEAGSHYRHIVEKMAELTGKRTDQLKIAYVGGSRIQTFPEESEKVMNTPTTSILYAFEIIAYSDWPASPVDSPVSFKNTGQTLAEIQRLSRQASNPVQLNSRPVNGATLRVQEDSTNGPEESSSSVRINTTSMPKRPSQEVAAVDTDQVELNNINPIGSDADLVKRLSCDSRASKCADSCRSSFSKPIIWKGYLIAYHRRLIRQDVYFVSPNNIMPSLFGLPLLVPFYPGRSSGQDLFKSVWTLVSRFVSPLPSAEGTAAANHAQDCDDSLGYEYPFVLKAVSQDGLSCGWCPWWKYCRGCDIMCDSDPLFCSVLEDGQSIVFDSSKLDGLHIAVEWDPTALHLRYQTSLERAFIEHPSVSESSRQMTEPVNLKRCLEAFTLEERLSDEEKVYCPNCHSHQNAIKKLQIWRLPPVLIIHLKRFQLIGGRWMKSPKAVHFTLDPLDPSDYLAAVPRQAVLSRKVSLNGIDHNDNTHAFLTDSDANRSTRSDEQDSGFSDSHELVANGHAGGRRKRVESTSLLSHPPSKWATVQDFHEHKLVPGHDPLDLSYRLYAAVCHNGIMGGGHYVAYACHEDGKWYCYNDSSCKEVQPNQIDPHDIYMLFYERIGLDSTKYVNTETPSCELDESLPSGNSSPGETDKKSELGLENDKKNCTVM